MDFVSGPKLGAWDTKSSVTDLSALGIPNLIMN